MLVLFGLIDMIAFIASAIACVVICIITLVYHVRNPELTMMQVWIWNWHRYWVWYLVAIGSYLLLLVVRKNLA